MRISDWSSDVCSSDLEIGRCLGRKRGDAEAAIAANRRGDAVEAGGAQLGIPEHLRIIMGVNVDEARRHDQSRGIDLALRWPRHRAHRRNPIPRNRDVAYETCRTAAVDDRTATNNQVVHLTTSHQTRVL